ncbi:aldo/keto reductase [Nocardia rhamnosiphila]
MMRTRRVPAQLTDERTLDAVEEPVPPAAEPGLSPAHSAIAFAVTHPDVTSAIIGPRTPARLDDLLAGAAVTLDDRIDRIVASRYRYRPARCGLPATRRRTPRATAASGGRAGGGPTR